MRSICKLVNEIKLNLLYGGKKIALKEMLPDNFCPLVFHSVYPYMLTLSKGGWFNWVGYHEHVIVNCPYSKGIAVYVKAPRKESPNLVGLEVVKKGDDCYKNYQMKDIIVFNFDRENSLRLKLLDSALSLIFKKAKDADYPDEFICDFEGESVPCRLEFE